MYSIMCTTSRSVSRLKISSLSSTPPMNSAFMIRYIDFRYSMPIIDIALQQTEYFYLAIVFIVF